MVGSWRFDDLRSRQRRENQTPQIMKTNLCDWFFYFKLIGLLRLVTPFIHLLRLIPYYLIRSHLVEIK